MAESFIQVPPDSTGKKTHTISSEIGGHTVEDQVVQIAASALPTGASTAAHQVTAQASLTAIAASIDSLDDKAISVDDTVIYIAGVAYTAKFAPIAASALGNNTLVAAVAGKKIRVLLYNLMGADAVNAKFQSGASGTDITGLKYIAQAGGGISVPLSPLGLFETAAGVLLNLNLSAAVGVGGELVYIEV